MLVEITDLAKSDIEFILDYTEGQWGEKQMNIYNDLLFDGIQDIAKNPLSAYSKRVGEYKEMLRYLRVKKHHIYYTVYEDIIYINRILHGQMNPNLHL